MEDSITITLNEHEAATLAFILLGRQMTLNAQEESPEHDLEMATITSIAEQCKTRILAAMLAKQN